jgi:AraC-like DNA-binding protein
MRKCRSSLTSRRWFCQRCKLKIDPLADVKACFSDFIEKTQGPGSAIYRNRVLRAITLPLKRLTNNAVRPAAIHFNHPQPADTSEHQRIFDCPRNEMVLHRKDLAQPILLANPQLLSQLEQFAREMLTRLYPPDTWADWVVHQINWCLSRGEKPFLGAIASALARSPRQLQNKLKEEEIAFRMLLDQVRKEAALKYLDEPNITICDIAFLLGFSEQSAFNHSFKRWTGANSGDYRRSDYLPYTLLNNASEDRRMIHGEVWDVIETDK